MIIFFEKNLLLIFSLLSLTTSLLFLPNNQSSNVSGVKTTVYETTVSAFIGEYRFSLFGYSSPKSLVTFSGLGIFDQTYADEYGYFEFNNRFSPFSPHEACLTAQDNLGRLTAPVCLPPFPVNYNVKIGPIIIPPTLSLNKSDYWLGDEVILSGQSIPKTTVILSIFTNEKKGLLTSLFNKINKPVSALSLPKIKAPTDEKGNFSIALPSSSVKNFRLFTQTEFKKDISPKSINLTVKILPWWMVIVKFFSFLWFLIKPRLLEVVILGEFIAILIYLLRLYFYPHKISQSKAIVLKRPQAIILYKEPSL